MLASMIAIIAMDVVTTGAVAILLDVALTVVVVVAMVVIIYIHSRCH